MGRGRDPNKLTTKQELFVQNIVSGKSQRKSYIDAGYKTENKDDKYIDIRASELFKNSKVLVRYQELIKKIEEETKKKVVWGRERAYKELMELLEDTKKAEQFPTRINAIKELNALDDLYPKEKKEVDLKVSSSDVFGKLKEAILNE